MKTESGPRSNRLNVWHCWWRLLGELLLGRLRQASKDGVRRSACCEMLWRSVQETSCHTSAVMNLLKTTTLIYTHEGISSTFLDYIYSGLQPCKDKSAKVSTRLHTSSPKLTAPRPVAWLLSNNNKTMLSSDENRIRSEEQPPQRLALLVAPFGGIAPWKVEAGKQGWRSAFGVLWDAMKECSGNKLSHFRSNESAQNTYTHEGISSTFFDYIYSGLQPCKDKSAKVSTRLHTSSPKLTAPRPVAWLLSNNNKTMLSSDENRIRSEEQPSQRLALLVAPFWGIAPWKVEAGKQGWRLAFGVLWDAMKECSGNKLSHFRSNESAQNNYTHLHSWRNLFDILRLHL